MSAAEKTTRFTINDKYFVDIDRFNHTLYERFTGKEGKPSERFHGYYPNLAQALRKTVLAESLCGGEIDLDSYIKRLERLSIK